MGRPVVALIEIGGQTESELESNLAEVREPEGFEVQPQLELKDRPPLADAVWSSPSPTCHELCCANMSCGWAGGVKS